MAYTKAKLSYHSAPINGEFGLAYASKLFGEDVIEQLPRYQRGPKKGQIKATLNWLKAESGGWVHGAGVTQPGLFRAWISTYPDYTEQTALRATFLGIENNPLAASSSLLGAENRARYVAQQQRYRDEQAAEFAEAARQDAAIRAELEAHADESWARPILAALNARSG